MLKICAFKKLFSSLGETLVRKVLECITGELLNWEHVPGRQLDNRSIKALKYWVSWPSNQTQVHLSASVFVCLRKYFCICPILNSLLGLFHFTVTKPWKVVLITTLRMWKVGSQGMRPVMVELACKDSGLLEAQAHKWRYASLRPPAMHVTGAQTCPLFHYL